MRIIKSPAPRSIGIANPDFPIELESITLERDNAIVDRVYKARLGFELENIPIAAYVLGRRAFYSLLVELRAKKAPPWRPQDETVVTSSSMDEPLKIFDTLVTLDPLADDDSIRVVGHASAIHLVKR